jgi:hypothetical protein
MKMVRILGTIVITALTLGSVVLADTAPAGNTAAPASTSDQSRPFQLALVAPAQLVPGDESIQGLRLNLIFGSNHNVSGVDIGLAHETTGDFRGIAFGLVSFVRGEGRGLQFDGIYSDASKSMSGLQVGLFNHSGSMHGVQIGLANFADDMTGIQIGLWNEIKNKEMWNVLPLFNCSF